MAEDKENSLGVIEKMALISDGIDSLFPNGKRVILLELGKDEYQSVVQNFRMGDRGSKKFSIDISGTEFIFVSDELLLDEKDILLKNPSEPKGRISTFFEWLRNQSQKYSRIFSERKTN
jgi:hypothetical protein